MCAAQLVQNSAALAWSMATLAASSYKLGFRGHKRYVRLALTKAGGTSIALGAYAIRGNLDDAPVA